MSGIQWDQELIEKYNINGPRYTSYPTALALSTDFNQAVVPDAIDNSSDELSLYVHIPFCHKLCFYCGCNKVITRHQHKADVYLDALAKEIAFYAPILAKKSINQLHLGGGSPTFLTEQQLSRLMSLLHTHFTILSDAEISIEIDPRSCGDDKLRHLRMLGFNRISLGVQDLDKNVQIAINRLQDTADIARQVALGKALGFRSINLDLIYGLPFQRVDSFTRTIDNIIHLNPHRISLFSYAHLPARFAAQRKITNSSLPDAKSKLTLMQLAIDRFVDAGYQFIGMDHFAQPEDELSVAQQRGKLQRNFQGYTTAGQGALVGLGVSSISQVDGVLWQNSKDLKGYYEHTSQHQAPIERGFCLSDDDRLRAAVISQLICHFKLNLIDFAQKWGVADFWHYFSDSFPRLQPFIDDGLLDIDQHSITVTAKGRLWVRSICSCFDAYLNQNQQQYSKIV